MAGMFEPLEEPAVEDGDGTADEEEEDDSYYEVIDEAEMDADVSGDGGGDDAEERGEVEGDPDDL